MQGSDQKIGRRNVTWNMVGSIAYALLSVLLLMVVTRTVGEEQAGVFSIAFTTGQLALTLGQFNMHPFQATDIRQEYSFKEYFTSRCLTCAAMLLFSAAYILISGYSVEKAIIVFLLCVYKMFDGLSDVFEGQFQQQGRLYIAGKAMTFRAVCAGTLFTVAIFTTKNLIFSCVIMVLTAFFSFLLFEVAAVGNAFQIGISKSRRVWRLLWFCLPLCVSSFMSNYIVNSSKYSIDRLMTETHQAHYGMIFMPAFAINLCSGFIFKPLLTKMAELWADKKHGPFLRIVLKLCLFVALLTVFALIVGWFLGIPVLSWFYATDLSEYQWPMMIILLGGGISAINVVIYYALTVMRCQRTVFWGYLITFLLSWLLPPLLVERVGLLGAAIAYATLIAVLDLTFLVFFMLAFRKNTQDSDSQEL